jgi:hypothetical protein
MIRKSNNIMRLKRAGILRKGAVLSHHDEVVLERLSKAEVAALIRAKAKVGAGLLRRHVKKGSDLIF